MKRIALLVLSAAMATDVSQKAYNSDLAVAIARRGPDQSIAHVLMQSPVMTTIAHWALFFVGFGLLSLLMANRKHRAGPDIIG